MIHPPGYVGNYITVPAARATLFRKKFSDRDQVTAEAGKYYALYHHDPSWKVLSTNLYKAGEIKATALAKPHVQTVTGMFCMYVFVSGMYWLQRIFLYYFSLSIAMLLANKKQYLMLEIFHMCW